MRISLPVIAFIALICAAPFAHADKMGKYKQPTQFEATEDF